MEPSGPRTLGPVLALRRQGGGGLALAARVDRSSHARAAPLLARSRTLPRYHAHGRSATGEPWNAHSEVADGTERRGRLSAGSPPSCWRAWSPAGVTHPGRAATQPGGTSTTSSLSSSRTTSTGTRSTGSTSSGRCVPRRPAPRAWPTSPRRSSSRWTCSRTATAASAGATGPCLAQSVVHGLGGWSGRSDPGVLPSGVGYVRVEGNFHSPLSTRELADQLQAAVQAQDRAGLVGWIVDLRQNGGGDMWPMLAGVGPVLGDGPAGSFVFPAGDDHAARRAGGQPDLVVLRRRGARRWTAQGERHDAVHAPGAGPRASPCCRTAARARLARRSPSPSSGAPAPGASARRPTACRAPT